jgi:hypothetical protein
MFTELGNRSSLLWSLVYLGHGLHFCGEYTEEVEVYERALALAEDLGDKIAMSLIPFLQIWLAICQGDTAGARAKADRVLDVGEDGHAGVRVGLPGFLALCDFLEGAYQDGSDRVDGPISTLLTEFIDAAGNEDPMGLWFLHLAGIIELTREETRERGRRRLADLFVRARRTGLLASIPNPLESAGALVALEKDAVAAARLFGAVDRLRRDTGIEMRYVVTQEMVDTGREIALRDLGPATFDRELKAGDAMSLPEVLDLATDVLTRNRVSA